MKNGLCAPGPPSRQVVSVAREISAKFHRDIIDLGASHQVPRCP